MRIYIKKIKTLTGEFDDKVYNKRQKYFKGGLSVKTFNNLTAYEKSFIDVDKTKNKINEEFDLNLELLNEIVESLNKKG